MNIFAQIRQESTEHFLTRLGLAIDEAKLARSTIKSNGLATRLATYEAVSRRLMLINREIELLETKRMKVNKYKGNATLFRKFHLRISLN